MGRKLFDHDAIVRDILASPDKCIDGEIALKHGCSVQNVQRIRQLHTNVSFGTREPDPLQEPIYHSKLEYYFSDPHLVAIATRDPYRVAREYLRERGINLPLSFIRELEDKFVCVDDPANARLSFVEGTAFVQCGTDLSDYQELG